MSDFLLELRSEEIPARMQVKAKDDLARLFAEEIAKSGLVADSIETFTTPRRLSLIAHGLPAETAAVSEERKGPRANAPEQALAGFLRSTGLTREQLVERDGVFFAVIDKPGRPTAEVLAEAIPAVIRAFPWPKSMRWGTASASTESLRWVRPLQGIVALLGNDVVPCEIDGIVSGRETMGHRFHHSGPVTIAGPDTYVETLRAAHVIVHLSERAAIIRDGAKTLATAAGLTLVEDEGLVLENAGLTEWPVPLLGSFDPAFLDVPPEVIQLTARVNQKYFVLRDAEGKLAPNFICTANIDASDDGKAVTGGNERVLSARLSDAKFFWENDLKVPLDVQREKLKDIVFHEKLGTVADKVDRVAKLARWLCEERIVGGSSHSSVTISRHPGPRAGVPLSISGEGSGTPDQVRGDEKLADLAERAARLCKADLVTGMVGEFPELQGIIGGDLARAQGEDDAVVGAIRDHYKPVGQGDDVPTDPVTVAVSLADKLDTLFAFFFISEKPTGSKDPFAIRRAGLAILSLIQTNGLRIDARSVFVEIAAVFIARSAHDGGWRAALGTSSPQDQLGDENFVFAKRLAAEVTLFLRDRLVQQQRDNGIRADIVEAAFESLGHVNDFVSLLARVKALQGFVTTPDGANLLAGYKRAANILKKSPSPLAGEGGAPLGAEGEGPAASAAEGLALASDSATSSAADAADPSPGANAPPSPARGEGLEIPLSYTPETSEAALIEALDAAEPRAAAAIAAEDFEGAMTALAALRAPIDAFFETVTINDPDADKRSARLALLLRVKNAVHRVADFSKIEG
ncbi:MAG: glycine--tRNA ligase subunit beta [Sphingomonadales bacterium]